MKAWYVEMLVFPSGSVFVRTSPRSSYVKIVVRPERIGLGQHVVVGVVRVAGDVAEGIDLGEDVAAVIVFVRRGVAEPILDRFNGIGFIKTELDRVAGCINDPCQSTLRVVVGAHLRCGPTDR